MVRNRVVSVAVALVLGTAVLGACSSSSKKTSTGSASATTEASGSGGGLSVTTAAPSGHVVTVTVSDTKGTDGAMTMTVSPDTVPAGDVTFNVTNKGTIDHETVLLDVATPFDKLPVSQDKVSEDKNIGETGDPALKPGESRSFTVKNLKAGHYVLVCNIEKHYAHGMRAAFTVQ